MKSLIQIYRQPLRTIAGILLVTLAVSVLTVSLSQTLAAESTAQKLKESFLCVAMPTDRALTATDWIDQMITENPDIVTRDVHHGMASAYIPGLLQDNEITHLSELQHLNQNHGFAPTAPVYSGGLLEVQVISVDAINEDKTYLERFDITADGTRSERIPTVDADYCIRASILSAYGIEESYPDYSGYTVLLYFDAEDFAAAEGDRFLVQADMIKDLDWRLRSFLVHNRRVMFWDDGIEVPYWHLNTLERHEDWQWVHTFQGLMETTERKLVGYTYKCRIADLYFTAKGSDAAMFRTLEIDLGTVDGKAYPFQKIDGDVASELAEAVWADALADHQTNHHAYAIVGVEQLNLVADFALKAVGISQGRDFTPEELESGAKVCMISEELAKINGLSIGDTIDPQFYEMTDLTNNIVTPTAQSFHRDTMELVSNGAYTIVGLYDQQIPWGNVDNNFFQFTPNTIFVPKASVPVNQLESEAGFLRTLVLEPDRMRDVQLLAVEAGYDGVFEYTDNGYSGMIQSLEGYREAAWKVLPLGLIVYAVLMALFLFLFPGRQGRELVMMDSMGANIFQRLNHGVLSCSGILVPGALAGTAVGIALWDQVAVALASYMDTQVEIILDTNLLWVACVMQTALVLAVTAVMVLVLIRTHNYMRRK